ncbi:MAG TPA: hypothetical protein DF613_01890 [Lachnospiraceae bacterium]|nr:hypothetical protein [Lachnospiraceae bacterium]
MKKREKKLKKREKKLKKSMETYLSSLLYDGDFLRERDHSHLRGTEGCFADGGSENLTMEERKAFTQRKMQQAEMSSRRNSEQEELMRKIFYAYVEQTHSIGKLKCRVKELERLPKIIQGNMDEVCAELEAERRKSHKLGKRCKKMESEISKIEALLLKVSRLLNVSDKSTLFDELGSEWKAYIRVRKYGNSYISPKSLPYTEE